MGASLRVMVAVASVLVSPATALTQEPTLRDLTIATCIGPEFDSTRVPYDVIAALPVDNCVRACKVAAQGCKAVVRAVDRCGVNFLRAAANTEMEVCRGIGATAQECRAVRDSFRADIEWWKAEGRQEQAACDEDTEILCSDRCGSLRSRVVQSRSAYGSRIVAVPGSGGEGPRFVLGEGLRFIFQPQSACGFNQVIQLPSAYALRLPGGARLAGGAAVYSSLLPAPGSYFSGATAGFSSGSISSYLSDSGPVPFTESTEAGFSEYQGGLTLGDGGLGEGVRTIVAPDLDWTPLSPNPDVRDGAISVIDYLDP